MLVCSSSSTSSKQIVFRKGLDIAPALVFENTCIADTGLLLTKETSRIQYRSHRCYNLHLHELIIALKVERRNINLNVDYIQLSASYSGIRDQKIQYMCTSLCHGSHEWGVFCVKFSSLSPSSSEFYIQFMTR